MDKICWLRTWLLMYPWNGLNLLTQISLAVGMFSILDYIVHRWGGQEIYNGPVAYLVVVFACSTIAQYWCHDHHDHCDHHGHDCHDQYWYHDRLTPFRGNCRLCFTWFQPIAGFWLLSLLLIIGSHCVSFSIPQQQPFNMKKKLMAKVVWSVFWSYVTSLIFDVILIFMFLTFCSLDMMSRAATGLQSR